MTLNSSQPDFAPNEPGHVLATILPQLDAVAVNAAVAALTAAGCLRIDRCDFPPMPSDAVLTGDLRITGYIVPSESTDDETPERYNIAVPDGTDIRGMLGLLAIAAEDILARRRQVET